MRKLGILASVLLLTAAIVGPIGLSYAEPAGFPKDGEARSDKLREQMMKERTESVEARKQQAAEIKAKLEAQKKAAGKSVDSDKDDVEMWVKHDIPNSAKLIEKLKAQAKELAAKKAASGPNESQIDIEKQRAEYQKKVEEYKKERQKMIEEQLKHLKDESQKRTETLKKLGAEEQLEKERLALEQQKRAEALKKQKYG
ncbi:MAG: hypothetical protein QXE82_06330 [Candidatus Nitrosotenuis sp.]